MAKAVRRKAPSRIRYERDHPTVSCRVPREAYERLKTVNETEGKSFADILKIGLGILEVQATEEAEFRRQVHAEGFKKGFLDAQRLYMVTYPCCICGEMITMTTAGEKEAAREYMQENVWGHTKCRKR